MHLFLCVDNKDGMMFHHRRQSRDILIYLDILRLCGGQTLHMSPYSLPLFPPEYHDRIRVSETFLRDAPSDACCFAEKPPFLPFLDRIRRVTLYRWNRLYPADIFLDIPLDPPYWQHLESAEFPGKSHKLITRDLYLQHAGELCKNNKTGELSQ